MEELNVINELNMIMNNIITVNNNCYYINNENIKFNTLLNIYKEYLSNVEDNANDSFMILLNGIKNRYICEYEQIEVIHELDNKYDNPYIALLLYDINNR